MKNKTQLERIERGQCPNCGKESAPYYLCWDCRHLGKIRRTMRRVSKVGGVTVEKRGTSNYYKMANERAWDSIIWKADAKAGDARLDPKLRGIRVDVEKTLLEVVLHAGRAVSLEEILAAWGRLRSKRTDPLAVDLSRIIAAEDKRKRKSQRYMERHK